MKLTEEILQERLQVKDILQSGAIIDLLRSVVCTGSKELLVILAEHNGLEKLMDNDEQLDVLDFFIDLATVLVNSYDERLGVMSSLVYLLCERDRYSIDIQWSWREARRLEKFILWLEPLLVHAKARSLLSYILNNYPPLRATPLMFQALQTTSQSILCAIGGEDEASMSLTGLAEGTDIIASMCYFGLGLEIREILKNDLILFDHYYPKIKDMRCAHNHCELVRMTKKAIRQRNETPIAENANAAKELLTSLGKCGLMRTAMGVDRLIRCLDLREGADDWTIERDDILLNFFTVYHLWEVEDLSPSFEELVGPIQPLHDALSSHRYLERYFALSLEGGRGGLPRGLGLWSVYYWRSSVMESEVLILSSAAWLQVMCEKVAEVRSSNMMPFDDGFFLPFVSCLFSAYSASLKLRPEHDGIKDLTYLCADEFVCTWNTDLSSAVARALGKIVGLVEAYILSSSKPKPKDTFSRHFLYLSCCLGIVCGVGEYGKIPELRRPVILPAGGACGMLTDICRSFLKMVTEHSDCMMTRRVAEISLMRAEQASGLRLVLG